MPRQSHPLPFLRSLPIAALVLLVGGFGCAPPGGGPAPASPVEQESSQPAGDDIRALTVDSEGRLYAGTPGGLYQWEPAAGLWRPLPYSEAAAVLDAHGTTLFAAGNGPDLYRVEPGGQEWTGLSDALYDLMGSVGSPIRPLAVDSVLYLTTGGSFVRSFDRGETWEHGLGEDQVPWSRPIMGPAQPAVQGFQNALVQAPDGTLYVGLGVRDGSGGPQPRIYRSRDGEEWTEVLPAPPHDPDYLVATSDGLRLQSMVNVEGEFRVTFRQFRLDHGAARWAEVELPDSMLQHMTLAGGDLYVFGQWGGFYRRQPSGDFQALDVPAAVNAVIEHDGRVYAGTNRGVFVSDDGSEWTPRNRGQRVDPEQVVEAATEAWGWGSGTPYYTSDDGVTWEARYWGLPPRPVIRGLAAGPDGSAWLLVSGDGLYEWEEGGWEHTDSSTATRRAYASQGSALVRSAEGTLLSGALIRSNQEEQPASVLFRHDGSSFQPVTNLPDLPDPNSVRRLSVDQLTVRPDGTIVIDVNAGNTLYHYQSEDDGVTWTRVEAPQ